MSTIIAYIIVGSITLVTTALLYVLFRFGQKSTVKTVTQVAGVILPSVAAMFKDQKEKTDTHDILTIVGNLAITAASLVRNPRKSKFEQARGDMVSFIQSSIRELDIKGLDKVSDEDVERMAEAAFLAAMAIPKVKTSLK